MHRAHCLCAEGLLSACRWECGSDNEIHNVIHIQSTAAAESILIEMQLLNPYPITNRISTQWNAAANQWYTAVELMSNGCYLLGDYSCNPHSIKSSCWHALQYLMKSAANQYPNSCWIHKLGTQLCYLHQVTTIIATSLLVWFRF